ncbi:MAG: phospholipid carrier-dependent glycosyltransferase [Candidatus Hydrogenedentes bacterium]|nr:phospholipid carrier-dependent glycosyltransferase [Candidatus Hydrogenedentota bacterium]
MRETTAPAAPVFELPPLLAIPLLLGLSALLSLTGLGRYGLWPPDEPRYAEVAREMMQSGDYLVPRVNGRLYQEKPPLMFWLVSLASLPTGDVTETTARIPAVLSALGVVLLTYLLARAMYGNTTAFIVGLVLCTTQRFWWEGRVLQLDMLLTFFMTGAMFSLWQWHTQRQPRHLVTLYLCIAGGALTKGPPALIFPVLAMSPACSVCLHSASRWEFFPHSITTSPHGSSVRRFAP